MGTHVITGCFQVLTHTAIGCVFATEIINQVKHITKCVFMLQMIQQGMVLTDDINQNKQGKHDFLATDYSEQGNTEHRKIPNITSNYHGSNIIV